MISDLASHSTLPWLVGGDFNEIFHNDEKRGVPLNLFVSLTVSKMLSLIMDYLILAILAMILRGKTIEIISGRMVGLFLCKHRLIPFIS